MKKICVNIVSKVNGVGLDQDVKLLKHALQSMGCSVTLSEHRRITSLWRLFDRSRRFDVNIFIERAFSCWFGSAKKNLLIPNQERFPKRLLHVLKNIDAILCKTQHAVDVFSRYHQHCILLGFTSPDRFEKGIKKDFTRFFHLAGKSTVKGTEDILALWGKNPEWPELIIVQHPSRAPSNVPDNVTLYAEHLSDAKLSKLQNEIGIHLCLSRCEGWGHYIVEAMSTGALVVTTNGAPMNELIDSSRGCLVDAAHSEFRHLGTSYYFDKSSLESEIKRLITLSEDEKSSYGVNARRWFLDNQADFYNKIGAVFSELKK